MRVRLQVAAPLLVCLTLGGCHARKTVQPPLIAQAPAPDLSKVPLYSPETTAAATAKLPNLPSDTAKLTVKPAPPPPPPKKHRAHHSRPSSKSSTTPSVASAASKSSAPLAKSGAPAAKPSAPAAKPSAPASEAGDPLTSASTGGAPPAAADASASSSHNEPPQFVPPPAASPAAEAQQAVVKPPSEKEATTSPIGQLTAGPTTDTDGAKREASSLIVSTEKGVSGIRRSLSYEERKAIAQIKTFLLQAQKALDNGDAEGAETLATKAKVLLAELTGQS